jgi:hypothetical protein
MIIMDKITLAEAEKGHRELWDWLAETCCTCKSRWPGWKKYDREAIHSFFACETADEDCNRCPIEWPGKFCAVGAGPYCLWERATDPAERKRLAAVIRDLPWREK